MTDILNTKNMKKMENWWFFLCMILWQNLPLYSSLTNYTKISTSMRTFRETQHVYKTKEAWQFHITHALTSQPSARMRSEGYCVCLSVCVLRDISLHDSPIALQTIPRIQRRIKVGIFATFESYGVKQERKSQYAN